MKVWVLLISDGRTECRDRTIDSAKAMLPKLDGLVEIDDSDRRLGFAGAIQAGWAEIRKRKPDYVLHLEQDFVFNVEVPVDRMVAVLTANPHLVQMALKRQPVNVEEKAAGGIVELHPDDFTQRTRHGDVWTEHRRFFTTNPSVYPAALCARGWPQVAESEGRFGLGLFEDPEARSAFWGGKFDAPMVEHIGERAGRGY